MWSKSASDECFVVMDEEEDVENSEKKHQENIMNK
jgi:hypothetical protein